MQEKESGKMNGFDVKKRKQLKKKRLIIRNLSFKVSEEELKNIFSEYGEVLDVAIPVMKDGRKRGFAFIQYADTKSLIKAMKAMNFKKIYGRPIAIDYAMSKTQYQVKTQQGKLEPFKSNNDSNTENVVMSESYSQDTEVKGTKSEEETTPDLAVERQSDSDVEMSNAEKRVKTFFKEFDADDQVDIEEEESSDNNSSDVEESCDDAELKSTETTDNHNFHKQEQNAKRSEDVSEGKTVFMRNVSFKVMEEDLQNILQNYGELEYCLICMDKLTDHPKGTAFAKFKLKENADKFIEEASRDPGIFVDGRKLLCTYAISRETLKQKEDDSQKPKDKRNLMLLKCGLILPGSEESKGVSQTDNAKRAQLEIAKKQKLKNVNFFVSDKRLAIHNLPKGFTNLELRRLFKQATGKEAIITEARVMKDFKKVNAKGIPASRGFGFVSFTKHEDALKALMLLNNNPKVFTAQKRPIVEFSIENKVALLTKERRREKIKMQNKKRVEERTKQEFDETVPVKQNKFPKQSARHKNKSKKNRNQHDFNKEKSMLIDKSEDVKTKLKKGKSQQKKTKSKARVSQEDKKSISLSINKYKKKLLDKMSQ